MNLKGILNNCLVFDIETSAEYSDGSEVSISSNHEDYLNLALVKWVGVYSFKDNKEYYLEVSKDKEKIKELFETHDTLIGFNSTEFDYPIMVNNGLIDENKWVRHIDCMQILGASRYVDKNGYKYKDRGTLMGYKFKGKSLECMAKEMELEFQKSTIDYKIFKKNEYTEEEKDEIIKYLKNDVMATKGLFDKLFDYWKPFTELISWENVTDFSWIRSSIASLIYKSACYQMGIEPTYGDKGAKESMGGNVFEPVYEEAENVWYVDFASLYPHIFCMFNLFSEVDKDTKNAWHGNEIFQTKGYYDVSYEHPLTKVVKKKLEERKNLKENDPDNSMIYTIKIWLNGLYGVARSQVFEKIHTPNCGWDCCWLGQQLQAFVQEELRKLGYEPIAGDTDSLMVLCKTEEHKDKEYMQQSLKNILKKIFESVPFPVDTFNIDIEAFIDYILFPFSEEHVVDEEEKELIRSKDEEKFEFTTDEDKKKIVVNKETKKIVKKGNKYVTVKKGKKKNYLYLYKKNGKTKLEIVGLPIKKDNATVLGYKIFNSVLKPKILKNKRAKFEREYINELIEEYMSKPEALSLCEIEYKVKRYDTYKIPKGKTEPSGIHAQISKGYFGGNEGVIRLIKNTKFGKAGKTDKYCTLEEAIENKLKPKDLVLDKVYNELEPFVLS